NAYFMQALSADRLADQLRNLPASGRPDNVVRQLTYPCVVTANGTSVEIQPLMGTADDGLYMRLSDIKKLGLTYTGRDFMTRQGMCRVYEGATFRFPNDYNGGIIEYHVPCVLGLPTSLTDAIHSDAGANSKKQGIVGLPLLGKHCVFMHHGAAHVVDLTVTPALANYFAGIAPLNGMRISVSGADDDRPASPPPHITLERCLAIAANPTKPYELVDSMGSIAINGFAELCRQCGRAEDPNEGIKISCCSRCRDENRNPRAIYCSKTCQAADWRARHKAEHAGTRPWITLSNPIN
ncbi:hypothetical protein FISHEDRAFT_40537, partial [Fistulina hepatica ATCC 64428]